MMDEAMSILRSKKNKAQDPDKAFGMTIGANLRSISDKQNKEFAKKKFKKSYFKVNLKILWLHLHQII